MRGPINPNNALKGLHTSYIANTGSGKTQAVIQMGLIPRASQVILFDPAEDYTVLSGLKVRRFYDMRQFMLAVMKARRKRASFRLSLTVEPTKHNLLTFCTFAWTLGDGGRLLHVVLEELVACELGSGKAEGALNKISVLGRKYGFILHTVYQRPQQVPKTLISSSNRIWCGKQKTTLDAKCIAGEVDLEVSQIKTLKPFEYFYSDEVGNITKGRLRKPRN
ncbi:hypothetical protein [Vibrio hepatarius]|uniref:hypothetical protein n=1 Tax=Vibrio hepatarius TaxID=171383 RepID=UPI0037355037